MKITINGKEYTTFEEGTITELGIDTTRKFIVCVDGTFNVGDILVLERDDNSINPFFRRVSDDETSFKNLCFVAYYDEPKEDKVIKELDGIKVGDKVKYEGESKTYYGYVAVIKGSGSPYLLRLEGFDGHNGYFWNEDWYPESEKKDEDNCYWVSKDEFKVVNECIIGGHLLETMSSVGIYRNNMGLGSNVGHYNVKNKGHLTNIYYFNDTNGHLTNLTKPTGNKFMSNVIKFAKELVLSKEEKLLRKYDLKNECGEYSCSAKELVLDKLVKENEAYLIEIAQKMSEDEDK